MGILFPGKLWSVAGRSMHIRIPGEEGPRATSGPTLQMCSHGVGTGLGLASQGPAHKEGMSDRATPATPAPTSEPHPAVCVRLIPGVCGCGQGGVSPCTWVFFSPPCELSFVHKEHKTEIRELGAQVLGVAPLFLSYLLKGRGRVNRKTRCQEKGQDAGWGGREGRVCRAAQEQSHSSSDVSASFLPLFLRRDPASTGPHGAPTGAFWKRLLTFQKARIVTPNKRDP